MSGSITVIERLQKRGLDYSRYIKVLLKDILNHFLQPTRDTTKSQRYKEFYREKKIDWESVLNDMFYSIDPFTLLFMSAVYLAQFSTSHSATEIRTLSYPFLSLQEAVSEAALSNSYLMLQIGLGRDMDKMRKGRDMSFTTPFLAYPQ